MFFEAWKSYFSIFSLDGTPVGPDWRLLWFFTINCFRSTTCPVFNGNLKSEKHWWQQFSCVRKGTRKITMVVFLRHQMGTKQSTSNCKSSPFVLILQFFCNCKCLPNKYWAFTQNSFTFFGTTQIISNDLSL